MPDKTVWLIDHEDYPESGGGIEHAAYASPRLAVEALKARYGPPYVVQWLPLASAGPGEDVLRLTGHFDAVRGYSIEHTASWSFIEVPLVADLPK